ncbi:MAG: ureidoglycolate lyase [Xanthobacteraceae bacterium]
MRGATSDPDTVIRDLPVRSITREAFAPFGDLIPPIEDGVPFGSDDAKLDLAGGIPRLYIMRLPRRGLEVRQITRHRGVTQCLAAMGGKSWLMAVAPPKELDRATAEPALTDIVGFFVPGTVAVKLHRGTWHAGPFFEDEEISFLNLELSDTNEVDHQNSSLLERFGCALRFAV